MKHLTTLAIAILLTACAPIDPPDRSTWSAAQHWERHAADSAGDSGDSGSAAE